MRAAEVIAAFSRSHPSVKWFGIGGPHMRQLGVETRYDIEDMAVMGISEVLRRYAFFRRVFREMLDWADQRKPDLALFIDYPGFNLRLAKQLHARGIKTAYYICPQVWAWHRSRIPKMAQYLDHLLSIFPFEAEHFAETALPVTYVGHPLVDSIHASNQLPEYQLPWNGIHRVAMLPGSRKQEIAYLLPVMLGAAAQLQKRIENCGFLVAAAGKNQTQQISGILEKTKNKPTKVTIVEEHTRDIVAQADAAMVCSGTATLETALLHCPMVVCYKTNILTYCIMKPLIRIPHIGLVNIVAGKQICPELVQGQLSPTRLANHMEKLIRQGIERKDMLANLTKVQRRIGGPGAAENAAHVISDMLGLATQSAKMEYAWS
jgi:lipid-A-disaccharide synthase